MAENEIRVGDEKTRLQLIVKDNGVLVPINDATIKEIVFQKSDDDETVVTKPAVFVTDGLDAELEYLTEAGFLDVAGLWKMQAYIESPSWSGHSDITEFEVFENLRVING